MPLFRIHGRVVHFVHIPKTGGASIEAWARSVGSVALLSGRPTGLPMSPQHLHAELHQQLGLCDVADWSFAVIREPLARLVSEYRMRRRQAELLAETPHISLSYADQPDLPIGRLAAFDAWTDHVLERCRRDPTVLDNHIRPQSDFITSRIELFRFEDGLSAAIAMLAHRTGLRNAPALPHANKSARAPLSASRTTIRRIVSFYSDDYEKLRYAPPAVDVMAPQLSEIAAALLSEPDFLDAEAATPSGRL